VQTRSRTAASFTVSEAEKSASKAEAKSLRIVASGGVGWDGASTGFCSVRRSHERAKARGPEKLSANEIVE